MLKIANNAAYVVLLMSEPLQINQPAGAEAAPQAIIDPAGKSGATAESGSLAMDVCAKTLTAKLA